MALVIEAPYRANPVIAARLADLAKGVGAAVAADIEGVLARASGPVDGGTVPASEAEILVERHGLASTRELALLALPVARALAHPPISGFRASAVGIEAESGDLVLGWNVEFPGSELGWTIHAEGFAPLRARRRGRTLAVLALHEAHPCAHCRQVLAESAGADELAIVDLLGHELALADLYPWPFRPTALGVPPDEPGSHPWPGLAFEGGAPPDDVAAVLVEVGSRAHAPYSGAPSAAALRLRDGRLLGAGCMENVAFNPTISALQAGLVELAAARARGDDVREAWLARVPDAPVDPAAGFRVLLEAVAPGATSHVVGWRLPATPPRDADA